MVGLAISDNLMQKLNPLRNRRYCYYPEESIFELITTIILLASLFRGNAVRSSSMNHFSKFGAAHKLCFLFLSVAAVMKLLWWGGVSLP